jgi:uncharacterized RDD family membrane protein YckC
LRFSNQRVEITVDSVDQLRIDTPEQIALELPLAGIGSRFLALGIDTLLQSILAVLGGLGFLWLPAGTSGLRFSMALGPALAVLFFFCVYWGYFALFEVVWRGQTPGKRYVGIRVIKESGRPIDAFEAIGRNLMRGIDGLPGFYGVGLVCMMLNQQHRRLGDFVAGTVVVHESRADEVQPAWSAPAKDTPSSAETAPQMAQVAAEELILIETYLHRRSDLDAAVRLQTAHQIAERIKAKTGLQKPDGVSDDDFLESSARRIRDGAPFR